MKREALIRARSKKWTNACS